MYLVIERMKVLESWCLKMVKVDCPLRLVETLWCPKEVAHKFKPGERVKVTLTPVSANENDRALDARCCAIHGSRSEVV